MHVLCVHAHLQASEHHQPVRLPISLDYLINRSFGTLRRRVTRRYSVLKCAGVFDLPEIYIVTKAYYRIVSQVRETVLDEFRMLISAQ